MNYFYADSNNQTVGPLDEAKLHGLYRESKISQDTLIIPEGESEWKAYGSLNLPTAVSSKPLAPPSIQHPVTHANPVVSQPVANTKDCPFCAESILISAKKCKHCGETLDVALRAADEAKRSAGSNQPMVFMNAGGGAVTQTAKKSFPHLLHFVLSVLTGGIWLLIWIFHYMFRSRSKYG